MQRTSLKSLLCSELQANVQLGSHIVLRKETESYTIGTVVPNHKELKIGTLKGIL
ncbi:type II toxin-antitoxin system HicA family toxin [Candidatus Woesearchaeota archaeon]|nr:type II toxin-antitoxin system HicA family toxin [Candidatus Woesearchaeota archaeon]